MSVLGLELGTSTNLDGSVVILHQPAAPQVRDGTSGSPTLAITRSSMQIDGLFYSVGRLGLVIAAAADEDGCSA